MLLNELNAMLNDCDLPSLPNYGVDTLSDYIDENIENFTGCDEIHDALTSEFSRARRLLETDISCNAMVDTYGQCGSYSDVDIDDDYDENY